MVGKMSGDAMRPSQPTRNSSSYGNDGTEESVENRKPVSRFPTRGPRRRTRLTPA
jgi:hypothetical protein